MTNYSVKYDHNKITISFKHISLIITEVTQEVVDYVKQLTLKSENFRYVYRSIVTNPNLTVQTQK